MKIIVKHSKPGAYHLFYPNDGWTKELLVAFNPKRPAKSFTFKQMQELKKLGFKCVIENSSQESPEL